MIPGGLVWPVRSHSASADDVSPCPSSQRDWPVPDPQELGVCLEHGCPCSSSAGCNLNPLSSRAGAKRLSVELSKQALEQLNKKASNSFRPQLNTSP